MIRTAIATTLLFLLAVQYATAQTATVEVTIQSVKPDSKELTASYKTSLGDKSITLDVSRKAEITLNGKAVDLDALGPGLKATVEFHKELAVVTKIQAAGEVLDFWSFVDWEQQGEANPDTAFTVTRDETLISRGDQKGWYLLTNKQFSAMSFSIEFRYPNGAKCKTGSIVVATPGPRDLKSPEWEKRIPLGVEVHLAPGRCGEIDLPRADFAAELPLGQIRDGRRVTRTRSKDPELDQWTTLEIECNTHKNVVVKLDGEVINAIAKAEHVDGRIAIWPMSADIEFRKPTISVDGKTERLPFRIAVPKAVEQNAKVDLRALAADAILLVSFDEGANRSSGSSILLQDRSQRRAVIDVQGLRLTPGKVGNALSFETGGRGREVAVPGEFPKGASPRGVALWIKAKTTGARDGAQHVFNYGVNSPFQSFGLLQINGRDWGFYDKAGGMGTGVRVDQEWHHHCVTYDGRTVKYYYDGEPTAWKDKALNTVATPLVLGRFHAFQGEIDEVAIFGRAISPNEVKRLHELGVAGKSLDAYAPTPR